MSWMELSFAATPEAIDWVRTLLATIDYQDDLVVTPCVVTPDQSEDQTANSIELESHESDWAFTTSLYLLNDSTAYARAEKIVQRLSSLRRTGDISEFMMAIVTEKPAITAEALTQSVGDRWLILAPEAVDVDRSDERIALKLGKTLAFGSGLHPTTILCLCLLERYVNPQMNALDLGSGTGILSVAIAKLGATVLAVDNDKAAVQATQETVNCNQVEQQVTVELGSLGQGSAMGHWLGWEAIDSVPAIDPAQKFDLVVANILGRMQVTLASNFQQVLRSQRAQSGWLITSGFTTEYELEVVTAMHQAGFTIVESLRDRDWVAIVFQLDTKSSTS